MIELRIKANSLGELIQKVNDALDDLEVAAKEEDLSEEPGISWQLDL